MIFKFVGKTVSFISANTVASLRCPRCKQVGTFDPVFQENSNRQHGMSDVRLQEQGSGYLISDLFFGQRTCPNPGCKAHIFLVYDNKDQRIAISYPAERIDFDVTKIPAPVVAALEEAITCHANQCFIAAAIMVRKTLELLCVDRGATGNNLKERIDGFKTAVILPAELLNGLHDLRLLGNDAAHIESQIYEKVEQEEVEVAIEVTKEVLKAVYQYSNLMGRLKALKKPDHV
jgi:hypothetical protein